jgi:hypothetical protein
MMLRLRPHEVSPVLPSLAILAFLTGAPTTTTAFSILDMLALTGDGVTCPVGCPLCHCINATESNVDACTRTRSVEACASNALDEYAPVCWAGGTTTSRGCARSDVGCVLFCHHEYCVIVSQISSTECSVMRHRWGTWRILVRASTTVVVVVVIVVVVPRAIAPPQGRARARAMVWGTTEAEATYTPQSIDQPINQLTNQPTN